MKSLSYHLSSGSVCPVLEMKKEALEPAPRGQLEGILRVLLLKSTLASLYHMTSNMFEFVE